MFTKSPGQEGEGSLVIATTIIAQDMKDASNQSPPTNQKKKKRAGKTGRKRRVRKKRTVTNKRRDAKKKERRRRSCEKGCVSSGKTAGTTSPKVYDPKDTEALSYLRARFTDILSSVTEALAFDSDFEQEVPDPTPTSQDKIVLPSFDFIEFRTEYVDNKLPKTKTIQEASKSEDTAKEIFKILTCNRNRRGPSSNYKMVESDYVDRLVAAVKANKPIQLVMPAFSVKCWNPLRVERKTPDLGEVYSLARLYGICKEIQAIYPPGATFIVLADGMIFAPVFGEPFSPAVEYRLHLQELVDKLDISNCIIVSDLLWLVIKHQKEFEEALTPALKATSEMWQLQGNNPSPERLAIVESVMGNMNLTMYPRRLLRKALTDTSDGEGDDGKLLSEEELRDLTNIREEIKQRAEQAGLWYTALVQALGQSQVIPRCFPGALRLTCRPKPGQIGLHMIGSASYNFPWNGVAVMGLKGQITIAFEDTVKDNPSYSAVHIGNDPFPFYYKQMK